jgi:hypothetical protein
MDFRVPIWLALIIGCGSTETRRSAPAVSAPRSESTNTIAGAPLPPRPAGSAAPTREDALALERELSFVGMCDASGAVPLDDKLFAVADDEDNILRVYDADRGGAPLGLADVSTKLGLPHKPKKPKKKPKPIKWPETDLEAATRIGDLAYWITSHGRNSSGKLKAERHRLFATTLPHDTQELELSVTGQSYDQLLADLFADPRFQRFDLIRASELAPKEEGGLNIEGMTARPEGGVWIGFRSPVPAGRALLFPLLNPEEVVRGTRARLGDPLTLDLGGLGIRSLSFWHGRYLIVAGHHADGAQSQLYAWNGRNRAERLGALPDRTFNPEGFFTPEERNSILLLSDDGGVVTDGKECKRLEDPGMKRFRGAWLRVEAAAK